MPRKSGGSEAPSEASTKTSLRRLSSIASFHALNPFNRRRSHNITSDSTASSSNVSLSSMAVHAPQRPSKLSATASTLQAFNTENATPSEVVHSPHRTADHACLPDDAIRDVPRKRTFSGLPLPTRARKNPPMVPSKSHPKLLSGRFPPTRLPSPPTSSRQHSSNHLAPTEDRQRNGANRVKRSDTEPLLSFHAGHTNNNIRASTFKENISPVSSHVLDSKARQSLHLPFSSFASQEALSDVSESSSTSHQETLPNLLAFTRFAEHSTNHQTKHASSPGLPASQDGSDTPGYVKPAPVQRWNSQPILSNTNNLHGAQHEIKPVRLMSERHPPTPPPPRTPGNLDVVVMNPTKTSISDRRRQNDKAAPSDVRSKAQIQTTATINSYGVHKAEAVSYWCGRFAALEDRYRNEELAASLHILSSSTRKSSASSEFWPRQESDQMHSPEATTKRRRRVIEQLHGLCTTAEARDSFVRFQLQFAAVQNDADLARPVVSGRFALCIRNASPGGLHSSEMRRATFMDRLLGRGGRNRRSLL